MSLANISASTVMNALKRGTPVDEITRKYGLSIEQLREAMDKKSNKKAMSQYDRMVADNEKTRRRNLEKVAVDNSKSSETKAAMADASGSIGNVDVDDTGNAKINEPKVVEVNGSKQRQKFLQQKLDEQSKWLRRFKHFQVIQLSGDTALKSLEEALKVATKKREETERAFKEAKKKEDEVQNLFETTRQKREKIMGQMNEAKEMLTLIEDEIISLQRTYVILPFFKGTVPELGEFYSSEPIHERPEVKVFSGNELLRDPSFKDMLEAGFQTAEEFKRALEFAKLVIRIKLECENVVVLCDDDRYNAVLKQQEVFGN